MPETTPYETFEEHFRTLGPGDVAHHSMLFPGIYAPDLPNHEKIKQGGTYVAEGQFWDATREAIANGTRIELLRVLPKAGEFGYDEDDLAVMRKKLGVWATVGVDARAVYFSDHAPRIIEHCEKSPVVEDVLAGLERGDSRKSSWAFFRKKAGRLVIDYLNTMDYENGEFLGRIQHYPPGPVNEHIAKWTFCWRDTYEQFGERINPLSS